jgi:hypothetical protein
VSSMLAGLAELPRWLWLVVKKWIWLLGLLPAALDIASMYMPGFPQVQIPLEWSIGMGCLGVFISAFLVHLDVKSRLAGYEYQEPEYDLQVLKVSSKVCGEDNIHVDAIFRMTRRNHWPGTLIEISLAGSDLPDGVAAGQISRTSYKPVDWQCYNMLKFPYTIPPAGCDFESTVHYPVVKPPDQRDKKQWEEAIVHLGLLIGYETQPVSYVQKSVPLDIPIDLGAVFEEFAASEIEEAT